MFKPVNNKTKAFSSTLCPVTCPDFRGQTWPPRRRGAVLRKDFRIDSHHLITVKICKSRNQVEPG